MVEPPAARRGTREASEVVGQGEATILRAIAGTSFAPSRAAGGGRRPATAGTAEGRLWRLAATVGAVVVAWELLSLGVEGARIVTVAPAAQAGIEAAAALARLFGALVLFLVPTETTGSRPRWVACGLVVLGLSGILFGYMPSLLDTTLTLNTLIYVSLVVWTIAGALFAIGLAPVTPPRFRPFSLIGVLALFDALALGVVALADRLPRLVRLNHGETATFSDAAILPTLTAWHWVLSIIPLSLAMLALVGAIRRPTGAGLSSWLVVAMTLLVGAQFHNLFWPAPYGTVVTPANLLRLAFAAVVVVGGVMALRRVAAERAALLAAAQETSRRLAEIAVLKADFTRMVAHELGAPIAAIRANATMLATGAMTPAEQTHGLATIQTEATALTALVDDIQTVASIEQNDFAVNVRPVPLTRLLSEAAAFARTLPGDHPLLVEGGEPASVMADPARIGQVLRNLLGNAAKYSPATAPIELRASRVGSRVRIEVRDRGHGIHPDDHARIFEKFGRGRDATGRRIPGAGVGLYLSRRIMRAHGADLEMDSAQGVGSVFGFVLEMAP